MQEILIEKRNNLNEKTAFGRSRGNHIVTIEDCESEIGKLFLLFIIEVIFLGNSMRINPFDQPAVENVKILTKKFLNSRKS